MHPPRPSDIQRVPRLESAIANMKLNSETPYYYADKDIDRSCSLFALAREEIDKGIVLARRNVNDHQDRRWKIRRQVRQDMRERLNASCGSPDDYCSQAHRDAFR